MKWKQKRDNVWINPKLKNGKQKKEKTMNWFKYSTQSFHKTNKRNKTGLFIDILCPFKLNCFHLSRRSRISIRCHREVKMRRGSVTNITVQ